MRSTERVPEGAVKTYEDLGDPQFKGRLCLRTSSNEYNQSFVADRIVKHGEADTEKLVRSWIDNDAQILGSDVDVLDAIAAGRCDVGLTNHYYLARELKDKPDFPVTPAWADQDGAGAHTNLSGVGLVKGSEHRAAAIRLMEFLTDREAQETIVSGGEFAANPDVPPAAHIREWADVKLDLIDVEEAGRSLPAAVALMQRAGWK
jgi:iron(III) transport system substrate-binding protein